jgi:ParB-like chromosome segregation protein Spo0J
MTGQMYAKAKESILLYGFIDPLTVRPVGKEFQIIDGEHRWRVGLELGMEDFPCVVVEGLSDPDAKKLTIVLNELHGQVDPDKMGPLLQGILADQTIDELMRALPFDESVVAAYMGTELPTLAELSAMPAPSSGPGDKEQWVERVFRLPKTAALVVDEAIEKAADGERIERWQALERVAADFLAG